MGVSPMIAVLRDVECAVVYHGHRRDADATIWFSRLNPITIPRPVNSGARLRLSKRTEYGLRAVVQLARLEPRTYVQSKDLSSGQEKLPNKFLEAVLLALRRGGFLESKVGSGGGYRLSRHPRDISVGELIRRLEGRLTVKEEISAGEQSPGQVAFRLLNEKLTSALDEVLDTMTLEQLMEHVAKASNQQQEMYYI
jgi:Rrf2 family cysteine metabolism transcriptional repressor